ncbi:Inner membrane protein YohC [Thalassocella blandensis]|nr:Inner membrane protein YohC [Thalassocella blandensis]
MAFLDHTIGIMIHPSSEWKLIRKQKESFKQVFLSHVPFLALIPAIASFIGVTQVGWSVGDAAPVKLTVASAMSLCALTYFALLGGVYVLGEFINWMSKTYGVQGPEERVHYDGAALAVYVTTPLMLAGVFMLYPALWLNSIVLTLAGAYSVYLIYEGIPILMKIDKDRAFMYASSVVTVGLVMMVTAMISTVLIWGMGIGPVFMD